MVSKDKKKRDKNREAYRKRRSEDASINSVDTVVEKRLILIDDQSNFIDDQSILFLFFYHKFLT